MVAHWYCSEMCAISLLFSKLKCLISVTQSPKYKLLKRIINQLSFVYIVAKFLYIQDTFTAHSLLLPFCASFIPRLTNTGDIDIPNLWVVSTGMSSVSEPGYQSSNPRGKIINFKLSRINSSQSDSLKGDILTSPGGLVGRASASFPLGNMHDAGR